MLADRNDGHALDRRRFLQTLLLPAALPVAAALTNATAAAQAAPAGGPEIIDCNVHLFDWPFRKLKYARTEALAAKLRKHRITKAWAGNFEAVLHTQFDAANRRLAEECRSKGDGMFVPIGSVDPGGPDWEEDLRRCHEQYKMPGVRLYPAYHGYSLDQPAFVVPTSSVLNGRSPIRRATASPEGRPTPWPRIRSRTARE